MGGQINDVTFVNLDRLLSEIPDKPIRDAEIGVDLASGSIESPVSLSIGPVSVIIKAGAEVRIDGFNSADDQDTEHVIGIQTATDDSANLAPQLRVGPSAYLKYRVTAEGKAEGHAVLPFFKADATGKAAVILADYRAHSPAKKVRRAVIDDLATPRFVVRKSDIAKLEIGDAVGMLARANLEVGVGLSWADTLSGQLSQLGRLLGSRSLLELDINLGAGFDATASVEDDFVVVFSRVDSGRIRVAVRKAKSRARGATANIGVDVKFQKPNMAKSVLYEALTAILGTKIEKVDELLNKTSLDQLSESQKNLLNDLLDRFGLYDSVEKLEALKVKWVEIQEKTNTLIEEIAKAKVAAGFRYEYQRVSEGTAMLQAVLSDAHAEAIHGAVLIGNVGEATRYLQGLRSQNFVLERFLNTKSLDQDKSWGFSLAVGPWSALGSRNRKKLVVSRQENFEGEQRVAYLGLRSYKGGIAGREDRWTVDFKADTSRFSPTPKASDLYYGLNISYEHEARRFRESELRQVLDESIAWRVIDEADEEDVFETLREAVGRKKAVTRLELAVDSELFIDLLPTLAAGGEDAISRALARAMPWRKHHSVRSIVDRRERAYSPLWKAYIENPGMTPSAAAELAHHHLRNDPVARTLARIEKNHYRTQHWTFAALIHDNPSTANAWRAFVEGCRHLQRAIDAGWSHDAVKTAFQQLEDFWRQYFYVRALGSYLAEIAGGLPGGLSRLNRSLTVEVPSEKRAVVFTTATADGD